MKIEKLTSTDIVDENIQKLQQLFPTAFREGKVVLEELQALLGEYVEKEQEYYEMSWAGKSTARQEANKMSTGTLRPALEESKDWEETENVFIEGDNLEVLKLLQKSYSDKVKMIYIDPPYNTGKDFVYKDNYKDNLSNYLELTGQTDDEGRRLSTNTESDGRYHSNWLNMMYPRLMLARNLLKEDGVIFISIDDNEQANLKRLCDEIFGEENFVANVIWERAFSPKNDAKYYSENHDYVLVFGRNIETFIPGRLDRTEDADKRYKNYDNDPRGVWMSSDLTVKTYSEKYDYPIATPSGRIIEPTQGRSWSISEEKIEELIHDNRIWFGKDGDNVPRLKRFLSEVQDGIVPTTLWKYKEVGHNQEGRQELKKLFDDQGFFDGPKPVRLIRRVLKVANVGNDDTVLDFFAGSGTTAHAVMQLNAEDGGKRKCISVQLPEPTDEKSQAFQAGYSTIAEISKERIRRAGQQILDDLEGEIRKKKEKLEKTIGGELVLQESDKGVRYVFPKGVLTDESVESALADLNDHRQRLQKLDTGFRVFKLESSNIVAWDTALDSFEGQLDAFAENDGEHIKRDRSEEDVLYEILLKYGLELTEPILEKECGGANVYNIGYGSMYICLAERIDSDVAVGIGEWHKEFSGAQPAVIFRDSGFPSDAAKTNVVQTLRQWGIDNVSSI